MNEFIKYIGIVLVFIGVIILGVYAVQNMTSNTYLILAGSLVFGGLVVHVIVNRVID